MSKENREVSIEEKFEQFVNEKYPYVIMDAFTAGYLEGKKELQKELDEAIEVIKSVKNCEVDVHRIAVRFLNKMEKQKRL